MAVGTGGAGGGGIYAPPPPIFCQPKKFKIVKTTTYRSVYRNMAKMLIAQWILEITDLLMNKIVSF